MQNKIATNRKSPQNEPDYINAYKQCNPRAEKKNDGLDVAAVKTINGVSGYGLMPEQYNRCRDNNPHRVQDFVSTAELRKAM